MMSRQTVRVPRPVLLPAVPNYFRSPEGEAIDIAQVDDDTLRTMGAMWTEMLIGHAHERRNGGESR